MYTPYHSQYWANALMLQVGEGIDSLSRSLASARVDLNPHQIDAALFAMRSPFSKGVILADEVGLGKTIEAGIVIAQRWAERRRRILLIVPATLRKQWQQEIEDKFSIPTIILEAKTFNQAIKKECNPFEPSDRLIICSYNFAAAKESEIKQISWDFVVVDEAHRLRNVYKSGNRMASAIAQAIAHAPKLLLTATPLQNSLLELYGLVSIIDSHVFGDLASFRSQFVRATDEAERNFDLRTRLIPLCQRTLRRQVLEYIRFTQRIPLTQDFLPTDAEHQLYEAVSAYLQRQFLLALPASQRSLMTLVLRKLLASSTFAIASTLRRLVERLEEMQRGKPKELISEADFEAIAELKEEWEELSSDRSIVDAQVLEEELTTLRSFADLAESISDNAKGQALISVLNQAFDIAALGAPRKAVIFTESRRTQQYLFDLLNKHGFEGQIVLINGSNTDLLSQSIYQRWLKQHQSTSAVSGSKSADMKAALVEEFRHRASLLIATESAAEGINLQFCALVVNYDLPWNPQRIEQRIGRCHRYGQQHDVVVVNFLNKRNAADQRVYELLSEKFKLFAGVFGASDEVLGALESGVDLEKRIAQVYQTCRTTEEIQAAFDALQAQLEATIQNRMTETRQTLLENFDEEVNARLQIHRQQATAKLCQWQQWLLELTRQELKNAAFEPESSRFAYQNGSSPIYYHLDWRAAEEQGDVFYSLEHPLAQKLVQTARDRKLTLATLRFNYHSYGAVISALKPFLSQCGWLELSKLVVASVQTEEFLIFAAECDNGTSLDRELCQKLLSLPAQVEPLHESPGDRLTTRRTNQIQICLSEVETRNGSYFDEEEAKLERWADDLKYGLEEEIKDLDRQIKEAKRLAKATITLAEKLNAQKEVKALESKRNQKRRELYNAQDEIEQMRDELISAIEQQLHYQHRLETLFTVRWMLN